MVTESDSVTTFDIGDYYIVLPNENKRIQNHYSKKFNLKKRYLMFCGIGNPHEFEQTLVKNKFIIKERIIYPDHYKIPNEIFNVASGKATKFSTIINSLIKIIKPNEKVKVIQKGITYGDLMGSLADTKKSKNS